MSTKAPTWEGEYCWPIIWSLHAIIHTSCFNPGITVWSSNHPVGKLFKILLSVGIIESSTDKSLSGEKSIFRICYSLYNNKNSGTFWIKSLPVSWLEYRLVFDRLLWMQQLMVWFSYLHISVRNHDWSSNYRHLPSAFSMTFGLFPSMIATQELVVPRSIPTTLYETC